MSNDIVIIGAGGHASVILDSCEKCGFKVAGYLAPATGRHAAAQFLPHLGNDSRLDDADFVGANVFIIGIGDIARRRELGARLNLRNARLATVVHPSAVIGSRVSLGEGSFVAAGSVISPGVRIGRHAIINTRASVDHDTILGDYVLIGPGVTLGGDVSVGAGVLIGVGAAVRPGVHIGADAVIGAGAAVVADIVPESLVFGVPARALNALK